MINPLWEVCRNVPKFSHSFKTFRDEIRSIRRRNFGCFWLHFPKTTKSIASIDKGPSIQKDGGKVLWRSAFLVLMYEFSKARAQTSVRKISYLRGMA